MDSILFRENNSPTKKAWQHIGIKHHHGINTPLFSLKSLKSSGIGEFLDLLFLIDWCHEIGFSIIQLLPLNDSGLDPSPYNALSALALHPIYISLHALPFIEKSDLAPFTALNHLPKIAYQEVLSLKLSFLKEYFKKHGSLIQSDLSYKAFVETTEWLQPYALFKVLKERYNGAHWNTWDASLQNPSKEGLHHLYALYQKEMEFYFLLQYFAHRQLKFVKSYANQKGIFLKGDIPILISPDSLDVWLHRNDFNLDLRAGAPPDMFTPEGQYWGFPTYRWEEIEKTDFMWWKSRLSSASEFYDIFRIDHIIGFYRIWAIAEGKQAKEGVFVPSEEEKALHQGEKLLTTLLSSTNMFPIGEDLGLFIDHIRESLAKLAIPGTKIPRWERHYESDASFIPYSDYPPCSLTTLSTHDTENLGEWWTLFPDDAKTFAAFSHIPYKETLEPDARYKILYDSHNSSSLFHINLLQEYLALNPKFVSENPRDDRINIPGTLPLMNWRYRYLPFLETITSDQKLLFSLKSLML